MADITGIVDKEMASFVKAHALANYNCGWDRVYECYDDEDIIEAVGSAGKGWATFEEAVEKLAVIEDEYRDYADEIRATAF